VLFDEASFKLLSIVQIPQTTRHLHVAYTLKSDYIIVMTLPDRIRLHNVADFKPRGTPPFPHDQDDVSDLTGRLHLDDDGDDDDDDDDDAQVPSQKIALSPLVKRRDIVAPEGEENLQAAVLGFHGLSLVALGLKGRVWIWTDTTD